MGNSPFEELAPELRNRIYEFAFESDEEGIQHLNDGEPALTMTCKQLRTESLPMFYGLATKLSVRIYDGDTKPLMRWLHYRKDSSHDLRLLRIILDSRRNDRIPILHDVDLYLLASKGLEGYISYEGWTLGHNWIDLYKALKTSHFGYTGLEIRWQKNIHSSCKPPYPPLWPGPTRLNDDCVLEMRRHAEFKRLFLEGLLEGR